MKTILPVLLALLMLTLAGFVSAQPAATTFAGNITVGAIPVTTGTVIDIFNGSNSAPAKSVTVGSGDQQRIDTARFNYSAVMNCDNSTATFLKVWGINGTAQGCIFSAEISANISVSLVANGAACKYGNACSSGYCCSGASSINSSTGSGTCQAGACVAATTTDTGGGGSSSSGGGGSGGAAKTTPASAPSQETVDVVKGALPATFQVAADAGNVEYKTVTAPELKEVPVAVEAVARTLEQLATVVSTEEAKQAVAGIQQAISSGGGGATVAVKKTIEVVKATNKVTGESVTVSVVKLSVTAPADKALKNVEVVEVIPKAVASNINQVTFKGEKPVVLQADPVVKWAFAEVLSGQTKDLSYAVSKDIGSLSTNTIAISKKVEEAAAPPAPEAPAPGAGEKPGEVKKPTPVSTMVLVVVLAVVVVGAWLFLKGRKKVMKQ